MGVNGTAEAFTGTTYGGKFSASSYSGVGVHAEVLSNSGATHGVIALSHSPNGIGVQAVNDAPTSQTAALMGSVTSDKGYAVVGIAASMADDAANVGVFGQNNNSALSAFAVYAKGKFAATGTKSFVMDHPFDPANKVLQHFCTEGPEPVNSYRGRVTLDEKGTAAVRLPDYFEAINADFEYQLTPLGAPMPMLHIAEEVVGSAFRISGGEPRGWVSWCVSGRRSDAWVKAHGASAEYQQPTHLKGKFLNPEQFVPLHEVIARSVYGLVPENCDPNLRPNSPAAGHSGEDLD